MSGSYTRRLSTSCVTLLKSVQNSLRYDDLCETPAQHTLQTVISGTFRLFLTRTQPPFVQYSTDLCQTKTAVRRIARSSGESNGREWWVSACFSGAECVGGVLPCWVLSLQHFRALDVTATPRPSAFVNLLTDLGSDLYVQKPFFDKTEHWSL